MTGTYSSLKLITERIEFLKNKLELSNELREKAVELCKKIVEKNIPRCRSTDTMAAAIIYAICRESGVNHTLNDIVKITGLKKNSIAKYYRIIINNLNQKMPIFEIESGVNRITTNMKISDDVKEIALELVNFAKKRNHVAGKAPMGVAAASLYLASVDMNTKISQRELAQIAHISEVTIRNRCKELVSLINLRYDL